MNSVLVKIKTLLQALTMPSTVYCYHCRAQHPRGDMRLVVIKTGKRWRCAQSIEAAKVGREKREAFGRKVSEVNKESMQAMRRMQSKTC
jgi:hypothetical protein